MCVSRINRWCETKGLNLNPSKTEVLWVTRKRTLNKPNIILKGVTLEPRESVKYLGITIDQKLSWKSHVDNKLVKVKRAIYAVNGALGRD
jgi:hypothetical protein